MGVSFVARKCTQCAGRLQYIKEKKLWKCLYCGAEIERQEQYDGLFTIKNVVRQCLLDTAFRRLDSAAKNLVECEKIDSRYVGTLIAKITHEMISVITPGACSERDVRNLFAQLKKNYELLRGISPTVTEEEEVLYEFLEEPDIFATLVLVYDSLNDSARRDYVLQMLDAKQVYSKDANGNLLTYALKNGRQDLADDVLSNTNNINVSMALSEVLQKYPDGDKKREHIADLIKTHALAHEDCAVIEKYLTSPCDSIDTKATVINAAVANGIDNVSPCVVWIDEIEKSLSVSDSGNDIGKRVLGQFLFWLQESRSRVFLVATANDVSLLPFELFRKGRFSEIFFIDLPNCSERRAAITQYVGRSLHIHLSEKDICQLIAASDGFSYSDIEYAIKEVAQSALIEGQAVITPQLLLKCFENVVPISKNNPDMVEKIRKWGSERAVAASNIAGGKADEQL